MVQAAILRMLIKGEKVAVVKIYGTEDREYSYFMNEKFEKGEEVIVPVKQGGPLHGVIRFISGASRYTSKAKLTIISRA